MIQEVDSELRFNPNFLTSQSRYDLHMDMRRSPSEGTVCVCAITTASRWRVCDSGRALASESAGPRHSEGSEVVEAPGSLALRPLRLPE